MSYSKDELEKLALEAIEEHWPPFVSHLVTYLPCSEATFYNHELEKLDTIKDALNRVKVAKKTKLLSRMEESDSASAQIAAYKLLSDQDEFAKLCGIQVDHTTKGDKVTGFEIEAPDEDQAQAD